MKYESNILKRLIDTYGVVGNPRYISEIIKEFIVRGKERFPDLFTYQADWLAHIDEFGLNTSYSVSYTGQSIYAPNTLERPVKSAILTGQTLVNLIDYTEFPYSSNIFNNDFHLKYELKTNTTYTIIVDINLNGVEPNTFGLGLLQYGVDWASNNSQYVNGLNKIKLTTNNLIANYLRIRGDGIIVNYAIVIEGDYTNVDIPYFDGIQSVKMPVLTTTGKNLFDGVNQGYYLNGETRLAGITDSDSGAVVDVSNINEVAVSSTTTQSRFRIACTNTLPQHGGGTVEVYNGVNLDGNSSTKTTIDCSNYKYLIVNATDLSIIQVEQGTQATSYEPYQTNILTVNEDVTLRGIGDVKDELNLLTGEVVERIGEIVLDGSQTLQPHSTVQGDTLMIKISDPSISFKQNSNRQESWDFSDMICDKELIAETTKWNADEWNEGYNIALISSASSSTYNINSFVLAIRKSYFNVQSIDEFKTWLTQNPLTIQYKSAKESIKTVDLNILDQNGQNIKQLMSFNGGTHFNTGSAEGSLLPVVSVSVETDLEETLRVCSLEGNTM